MSEAEALARQYSWPGTRAEDGLITVNPERAKSAARRQVRIGDRRFGVIGCGPDIFLSAPLARPSLQLEEICTVTGTPIRIVVTPSGVERADPSGAVVAMPHPRILDQVQAPAGASTRQPATSRRSSRRSTPTSARSGPCSPPPGRPKD